MCQIRRSRSGKTKKERGKEKERRKKSPVAVQPGKRKKEKRNILVAHEILYFISEKK